jgi:hypothetical protein
MTGSRALSAHDAAWSARVTAAGVRIDLWETDLDDRGFVLLGETILHAARDAALSDEDLYPLLVRLWNGCPPPVAWPPAAPKIARRCAAALAAQGICELDGATCAPTDLSLKAARKAVVAELNITPSELLSVLADHWAEVADLEMPTGGGCSLLAFAQHVLLEPLVGAAALLWSALDSPPGRPECTDQAWDDWSPVAGSNWTAVVAAEFGELGRPAEDVPEDADEAAGLLASARADLIRSRGDRVAVAASIVRTSGWPGATGVVAPFASEALDLALQRSEDVDPETDNDELIDAIQRRLMPDDGILIEWIRDPSYGTLSDRDGSSRTGVEMLHTAADWLMWSFACAAVEVVGAMSKASPSHT